MTVMMLLRFLGVNNVEALPSHTFSILAEMISLPPKRDCICVCIPQLHTMATVFALLLLKY